MKLYIIPGYGEGEAEYRWLIDAAASTYDVRFLDLQMKPGVSLQDLISTPVDPDSTVLGFSCGAAIAFKLRTPVKKGIYCSIANAFESDRVIDDPEDLEMFGEPLLAEMIATRYGKPNAKEFVIMHGETGFFPRHRKLQEEFGMRVIPATDHEFTPAYKAAVFEELGIAQPATA